MRSKMKKRILQLSLLMLGVPILIFVIYLGAIIVDIINENNWRTDAPGSIGSFNVIESSLIDPTTILSSLNSDNQGVFEFKSGLPDNPEFVTSVEWRQKDFTNLATGIFNIVWNESANDWRLYKMDYYTECNTPDGFSSGEILFFQQDISNNKKYSARSILMDPENGYVAWGSSTDYRRPLFGWKAINLSEVTVTAEDALQKAEVLGGKKIRQSWNNECSIFVALWPEDLGRYEWRVDYWDKNISNEYRNKEFWIPTK